MALTDTFIRQVKHSGSTATARSLFPLVPLHTLRISFFLKAFYMPLNSSSRNAKRPSVSLTSTSAEKAVVWLPPRHQQIHQHNNLDDAVSIIECKLT